MFEKCSLEAYNGNDFHSSSCWIYIEGWCEIYVECSGLVSIMPEKRVYSVHVFLLCVLHVLHQRRVVYTISEFYFAV